MNASVIFATEHGNNYLYDANTMYVLNLHPAIRTIHRHAGNDSKESVREKIKRGISGVAGARYLFLLR